MRTHIRSHAYINMLKFCYLGISAVVINIYKSVALNSVVVHLDLTSLSRFPRLNEVWITGYPEQRVTIGFNRSERMTPLPIQHLHMYMKLWLPGFDEFYSQSNGIRNFLGALHNLKSIDLRNLQQPRFLLGMFYHGIANHESVPKKRNKFFYISAV